MIANLDFWPSLTSNLPLSARNRKNRNKDKRLEWPRIFLKNRNVLILCFILHNLIHITLRPNHSVGAQVATSQNIFSAYTANRLHQCLDKGKLQCCTCRFVKVKLLQVCRICSNLWWKYPYDVAKHPKFVAGLFSLASLKTALSPSIRPSSSQMMFLGHTHLLKCDSDWQKASSGSSHQGISPWLDKQSKGHYPVIA
jgi:hypothetical protein